MKLFFGILLFLVVSCELTAVQEEKLNQQLTAYLNATNAKNTLKLVALTHSSVVKFYHQQGDSVFINHFELDLKKNGLVLSNPILESQSSDSKSIQRKYLVEKYEQIDGITERYCIFALSSDNGNSWFFCTEEDYFDQRIKGLNRIFKQE